MFFTTVAVTAPSMLVLSCRFFILVSCLLLSSSLCDGPRRSRRKRSFSTQAPHAAKDFIGIMPLRRLAKLTVRTENRPSLGFGLVRE